MDWLLPFLLGLMMFTMGLTIGKADFLRVLTLPKLVVVGLACQLLLLPVLGFSIAKLFVMPAALAMGFIAICVCPGGILSNYVSFKADGNVALSVTLTLCSSIVTVFSIPILLNASQQWLGINETAISLPLGSTMLSIAKMTLLPIVAGMFINYQFSSTASVLSRHLSTLCTVGLVGYILFLWYQQKAQILSAATQVGVPILLLVLGSSLIVFLISTKLRIRAADRTTLIIETGIQNSALAFTVTAVLMKNPTYAIPTVFYSVAMFIPALLLIFFGRRQ